MVYFTYSRPLVMMSTGSLHSSSTLLASSPNNSICEVTDIEADDSLEPPQVSISSCDSGGGVQPDFEPESSSLSIYESPMSSIYETPLQSPTYATPMEGRSPWASPRASLRSDSSASSSTAAAAVAVVVNGMNSQPQRGDTARPFTG